MEKSYDPKQIENTIYQQWESKNYFKPSNRGAAYSIVLPPPNITGYLHMGHGFQHTLMDALIRYHRMKGYNTLWQPGTDHAGIATQMVVERQLAAEEKHDMTSDAIRLSNAFGNGKKIQATPLSNKCGVLAILLTGLANDLRWTRASQTLSIKHL